MYLYYIALGFVPAIFYLWYFYSKDKWEPEPKGQVFKIFILGIISTIPAGILEVILQKKVFAISNLDMSYSVSLALVACFIVIGPIEEFFKYSVVKVFIYFKSDFNEKVDGVVYMVASAMGFSALENVLYILREAKLDPDRATYLAIMRGLLSTPAHAIFSGFFGLYLGRARFASNWFSAIGLTLIGFFIAVFLHGLYDAIIFIGKFPYAYGVIPLLLISGYILVKEMDKLVDESPFKPKDPEQTTQQSQN